MTDLDRRVLLGVAGMAGIAAINRATRAGSLNPPSGPVTPTMKTLDEVEARTPVQSLAGNNSSQYVISQSGSYYLTANIAGVSGLNGIEVDAPNVSIDLNGFSLLGTGGSLHGILTSGLASSFSVFNGNINAWDGVGVNAGNSSDSRVEQMTVTSCNGGGIAVSARTRIDSCIVNHCKVYGISTLNTCQIVHCIVSSMLSAGNGIICDYATRIENCTVSENDGIGIVGVGAGIFIRGSYFSFNNGNGIDLNSSFNEISSTIATDNHGNGIHVNGSYNRIDGCSLNQNGMNGILLDTQNGLNIVTRCSSTNNASANYSIPAGNRQALMVTWSLASGYTSADPLANI